MSDLFFNSLYLLFSLFVSGVFWWKDSNKPLIRVFISAHSLLLLLTLIGVMHFSLNLGIYNNAYLSSAFWVLMFIALLSIASSFSFFKGSKWIFILHLWNSIAFITTLFIGIMALSNDWL
jgi:hypothetical protein